MRKRQIFEFFGTLNKITTKLNGDGRMELDFPRECLNALQGLQRLQLDGNVTIAIAAVPVYPGEEMPDIHVEEVDEIKNPDEPSDCGPDSVGSVDGVCHDPAED